MECSPLGYSVHGLLQARILEWVAIPFSRGSSGPRDQTWISCIVGRVFTLSAIEKSLAPTLLHPSFKGRTNRKPMALVKRAVLTCHHYQTSFLWLGWRRMLPKAKMEVSRELLIKSWMPTSKGDWTFTFSLDVSLARGFLDCSFTIGGEKQKLKRDDRVRDY